MKANLSTLGWGGDLFAQLENGETITEADALKMAEKLIAAGVKVSELTRNDWKIDATTAPGSGQLIAILSAMNTHEN